MKKKFLKKIEVLTKEAFRFNRSCRKLKSDVNICRSDLRKVYDAFDPNYYITKNKDLKIKKKDAFIYFMKWGWVKNHNPSPNFDTVYYLENNPDIKDAFVNPFIHWVLKGNQENRQARPRLQYSGDFSPLVSVIVPNYNHGAYLEDRINSILLQNYTNYELIILDDVSTDNSREIIQKYADRYPEKIKIHFNEKNSGNVFKQWQKGLELANGELIWICESDDFCEDDFLSHLIPYFNDLSVNIAFGRIQFANHDGSFMEGADSYRENAEPGIWKEPVIRPAAEWFSKSFGVNNIIPNVGGCLLRNQKISSSIWQTTTTFSVLGDWYLYLRLARGGQIVYNPNAIAYFRQHEDNTSVVAFKQEKFYTEHHRFMKELCATWSIPEQTIKNFYAGVESLYNRHNMDTSLGSFSDFFNLPELLRTSQVKPHINIAFLGFHVGGGELFPINLANELHHKGYNISMTAFDLSQVNEEMRSSLTIGIPVYNCPSISTVYESFIPDTQIDLIHTHMVCLESYFLEDHSKPDCTYLVSLHGSYEACEIEEERVDLYSKEADLFIYTADRNLTSFDNLKVNSAKFLKLANAMPYDERPFPLSKKELGIAEDSVVFTLVARGIKRKGWRAALNAFIQLKDDHPSLEMHLLLCGDGDNVQKLKETYGSHPNISFLGFQSCIHGLYRISDVALLPTRFSGESYPLCLIQAIQCGLPVIGTKVGEIDSIVVENEIGICIEPCRDTKTFTKNLRLTMEEFLSEDVRNSFSRNTHHIKENFSMEKLADTYYRIYSQKISEKISSSHIKSSSE